MDFLENRSHSNSVSVHAKNALWFLGSVNSCNSPLLSYIEISPPKPNCLLSLMLLLMGKYYQVNHHTTVVNRYISQYHNFLHIMPAVTTTEKREKKEKTTLDLMDRTASIWVSARHDRIIVKHFLYHHHQGAIKCFCKNGVIIESLLSVNLTASDYCVLSWAVAVIKR